MSSPPFNVLVETRHGKFLCNRNDLYIGRSLQLYGEVNENEVQLLKLLAPEGGVVLDVGANIGSHTVPLAQHVGPKGWVYAFEPQRVVFQTLCANVALNSLTNVDCIPAALSDAPGSVLIPDIDYTRESNFGAVEVSTFGVGRPVSQITLDDFAGLPRVDIVKIDVEGMEQRVLAGGKRFFQRFRPILYVENDRVEKSRRLIEYLWSLDYRLFWHLPSFFNPENFRGNKENAFPNLIASNMLCFPKQLRMDVPPEGEIVDADDHPTKSLPQYEG